MESRSNMDKEITKEHHCPAETFVKILGGKYKIIIVFKLRDKILRYNEIQKEIPKATPKMLSQQLKELEADGIINRVLYPTVPPKTEYSLTELGKTLIPVVDEICNWGKSYIDTYQK